MRTTRYSSLLRGGFLILCSALVFLAVGLEASAWAMLCFAYPAVRNGRKTTKHERTIDLDSKQYEILKNIIESHIPYSEVWAYGSRVKWNASPNADLDLVVKGCDSQTLGVLRDALEESGLIINVDVMDWETIPDDFKKNIKRKHVIIQEQESLPTGWRKVKLKDVAKVHYGQSLTKNNRIEGDTPVYSSAGLIDWHNESYVGGPGLIIGRKGTIGSVYRSNSPFFPIDTTFYISESEIDCSLSFLYYALCNRGLNLLDSDSAVPGLNRQTLLAQEILLPPPAEQEAVSKVLEGLDNKIDLLRQQNKTLESIAEALFKKCFSSHKKSTGAMVKMKDLCVNIASGGTPSTANTSYYNGNINWYTTKELNDNFLIESKAKISQNGLDNSSAKMFPKGTVIIAIYAAPTVGRLGILSSEGCFNQAACGLIADDSKSSKEFIYLHLKSQRSILSRIASGAAQQNLNVSIIKNFLVTRPDKGTLHEFQNLAVPLFEKIEDNTHQIRILEDMRNLLLPKMMDGVLRVQ